MFKWIFLGLTLLTVVLSLMGVFSVLNIGIIRYNGIVAGEQAAVEAIGLVKAEYQRRWDLIPNLTEFVKAYMKHEKGTLVEVIEARASASKVNFTSKNIKQIEKIEGSLSQALGKLLITIEQYPNLKANENISQLQSDLKQTESYIAQARQNYNNTVRQYNTYIKQFPNNIVAGMFHFKDYEYFELVNEEAYNAPKLDF